MNKKQLKLAEKLYGLGLHEWCFLDDSPDSDIATRVPGGWIYRSQEEQVAGHFAVVETFVPYNDEFNPANLIIAANYQKAQYNERNNRKR